MLHDPWSDFMVVVCCSSCCISCLSAGINDESFSRPNGEFKIRSFRNLLHRTTTEFFDFTGTNVLIGLVLFK